LEKNYVVCISYKDCYIIKETKYDNKLQEVERFVSNWKKNISVEEVIWFGNLEQKNGSRYTKYLRNLEFLSYYLIT
jgi:hypothetical protein